MTNQTNMQMLSAVMARCSEGCRIDAIKYTNVDGKQETIIFTDGGPVTINDDLIKSGILEQRMNALDKRTKFFEQGH